MKRKISKILSMAIVAIMMMSTIAFADAAMEDPAVAGKTVTVTLSGLTANEEATILVVKDGVTLDDVDDSDIVYINQLTVGSDKTVTFTLDASAAIPAEPTADVYVDIFCGYTNMADADPLEGTAKIYTYVAEEPDPEIVYGDVNGNGKVNTGDATQILKYDAGVVDLTEAQLVAADVSGNGKVNTGDATQILKYDAGIIDVFPVEQ